MGNQKNTITLNGRLYDAKTGDLFAHTAHKRATQEPKTKHPRSGKMLNDFLAPRKVQPVKTAVPRGEPTQTTSPKARHAPHPVKLATHHRPQHAKTLMRGAVKKPPEEGGSTKTSSRVLVSRPLAPLVSDIAPPPLNRTRLLRAKRVAKSDFITRFGAGESTVVKRHEPLAVKKPPTQGLPSRVHSSAPSISSVSMPMPSVATDIFTEGLRQATSHEQPRPPAEKRRHRMARKLHIGKRAANIVVSSLIVLALGGFIAMQNAPNLQMRLAAGRAGLHAQLPAYKPSGFALKGVAASPGQVIVSFFSNSDNRNFQIKQTASNWNSETLKEAYVASINQPYQAHESKDKTIYVYGNSNATWVDSGIWYSIESNSNLTNNQLLKIANSF